MYNNNSTNQKSINRYEYRSYFCAYDVSKKNWRGYVL